MDCGVVPPRRGDKPRGPSFNVSSRPLSCLEEMVALRRGERSGSGESCDDDDVDS